MNNLDEVLREIHSQKSRGIYSNKTKGLNTRYFVYGETNFSAIESIVNRFKEYFNEDAVFYDLGSGTGKIPIHIGLKYKVKKSVGIEFSKERCKFISDIKEKYPNLDYSNISILNESFFDSDISDATIIYLDNTMYTEPDYEYPIYNKIPDGCMIIHRKQIFNRGKGEIDDMYKTSYGKNIIYHHVKKDNITESEIEDKKKLLESIHIKKESK